jgi:hypothetical protein
MRLYNRRLAATWQKPARKRGFGIDNEGAEGFCGGFQFPSSPDLRTAFDGLWVWLKLECSEGWRTWTGSRAANEPEGRSPQSPKILVVVRACLNMESPDPTDEELVRRTQAGDARAFDELG